MGIFDLFGSKAVPLDQMFTMVSEFHPFKLTANKADSIDLEVRLTNNLDKEVLTSVVVQVPKPLGLDKSGFMQQRELRLGTLQAHETKDIKVQIYSGQRVSKGTYPVMIFAISHYRDYSYILNEMRKRVELRVV
ncbi:MAG TPA: hypothetical protein VJI13_06260 [Candidatus Norongarragalinales archaeon]|nr:hypothetical protein [Candidatus Norongarragalinales archaeon]